MGGVGGALLLCLAGYLVMRKRGQAGTGAGTFNQAYQTGGFWTKGVGGRWAVLLSVDGWLPPLTSCWGRPAVSR